MSDAVEDFIKLRQDHFKSICNTAIMAVILLTIGGIAFILFA